MIEILAIKRILHVYRIGWLTSSEMEAMAKMDRWVMNYGFSGAPRNTILASLSPVR